MPLEREWVSFIIRIRIAERSGSLELLTGGSF